MARTYESLPLYLEVAFIYLMFSTILTQVQRWGEKKLNAKASARIPEEVPPCRRC